MGYREELHYADLASRLNNLGQAHVFRFWQELTPDQQTDFAAQLESLDWPLIDKVVHEMIRHPSKFQLTGDVQPAPYYEYQPTDPARQAKMSQAFARGEELLRQGKVAAFVVAGGQGSRLGWDAPKGTFPATPVKKKPLFQCFAEFLRALAQRYGAEIPFYIMTSPQNDAPTRQYWKTNGFFGLHPQNVTFLPQDQLPAFSFDGKVLLERKDSLALSPNGHGGSLLALWKSGALADMKKRGITQISYFQVDNPIVRCVDPLFIGLHDLDGAQMSSKMLPKTGPREKLGNFCLIDGKMSIIEYSDLPDELAEQRLATGELRFRAGSIALHAIRVDFVEQINTSGGSGGGGEGDRGFALPFHRAEKKIPCIDLDTGAPIKPNQPNAVKLETFVFDALPLTRTSVLYQTDRIDEFAPIKNAEGVDSAASATAIITERNARWLEAAGIRVPRRPDGAPDCLLEISPLFALYPQDIKSKASAVPPITPGTKLYLGPD